MSTQTGLGLYLPLPLRWVGPTPIKNLKTSPTAPHCHNPVSPPNRNQCCADAGAVTPEPPCKSHGGRSNQVPRRPLGGPVFKTLTVN